MTTANLRPSGFERNISKPRWCGVPIHLRKKIKHRTRMTIGALCSSWRCLKCGPYLKSKWVEHLSLKIVASGDNLFVSVIQRPRWNALKMKILRHAGSFARVEQGDGSIVVISTMCGDKGLSIPEALDCVEHAVEGAATHHRPIYTSRGWKQPKNPPKMGEWERISRLTATLEDVKKVVKASGIAANPFWGNLCTGFIFILPEEWTEEQVAEFDNKLLGLGKRKR